LEIALDPARNYATELAKEWVVGNGLGGYASSTVLGINTRKYHGLLVAPTEDPPFGRKLLLSKLEESLVGETTIPLSANEYPGAIYPDGHLRLRKFRFDPLPTFLYRLPEVLVKKTIFMPHGNNAVVANYRVWDPSKKPFRVVVNPIVNFRDIHGLTKAGSVEFRQRSDGKKVEVLAGQRTALIIGSDQMDYRQSQLPDGERWFRNFVYSQERARGYEFKEDQYCPGSFEFSIAGDTEFNIVAAGGRNAEENFRLLYRQDPGWFEHMKIGATLRLDELAEKVPQEGWGKYLAWAADSFLVDGKMIAGYHWFGCWGRDTLISLPGLTLATGRHEAARRILFDLANRRKNGIIPNWFESMAANYDCIDASLLFIYAFHKYLTYTDDVASAKELWKVGLETVGNCVEGRIDGVRVEDDGMMWSNRTTWMDVKIDGVRVTPRVGKTVGINALWYNSLRSMEAIGGRVGKPFKFRGLADKVKENFAPTFWNERRKCLYDVVSDGSKDESLRPNQIFAASLPFPVLDGPRSMMVLKMVREKLLTPCGLRSLARDEPGYMGKYSGGVAERDLAYHQGTVWSWLIGPFVTAFVRLGGEKAKAEEFLGRLVEDHLKEAGMGTISEVFDGDEPHEPRGCISQAWSVAEIIRCYVEDIKGIKPAFEGKYGLK